MRKIKKTEAFLLLLLIIGILVLFIMVKASDKEGKEDNEKETKTEDKNISKAYFEQCKKHLLALGTPGEILAECSEEQIIFIAENLKEGEIYEAVDSFAFALNEDWEIVPGMLEQMNVCLKNSGEMKHDKTYQSFAASQYGYAYSFIEGIAEPNSYYEGYGVFCSKKKNIDAAAVKILMTYVHDSSSLLTDEAYSLNISPGLVSVSSDSSKIKVYENVMKLNINSYE